MKKRLMKLVMAITALALFFCQYACAGSSGSYYSKADDTYYETTAAVSETYNEEGEYYEEGGYYAEEAAEAPYGAAEKNGTIQSIIRDDDDGSGDESIEPAALDEKLVYTCTMEMETTEYKETIAAIQELIKKYEAIIGHESYTDSARDWYYTNYEKRTGTLSAYLVIRVPSQNYQDFLNGMQGFGQITSSTQDVENITRHYSETQTTIRSLETQEDRLLEMMENAETIEEMLAIEDRLTDVQNELQILRNRLSEMDTDVAYSTVNLTIREVVEYSPIDNPIKTLTFGDRLKNTLAESWQTFKDFLEGLLFFLIRATPILLVLGVISVGIMLIIMAIVKGSRKRREKKAKKETAAE